MDRRVDAPDLRQYPTVPRYNMLAVEKATGLSPRTLRSWERRYGVPSPQRDASGRRLYSERDLALIHWLTDQVARGITIGRAVAMLEEDGGGVTRPAPAPVDLDRLQLRLLQAFDWMEEDEATDTLRVALETVPLERVLLDLVQPVLYRVGDLWASGRMSVASEHFGTQVVRSVLTDLLRRAAPPSRRQHVLVGSAPGEEHDVGSLVLALLLRRAGFRVTYLGPNLEAESLRADLDRIRPNALCLSATTESAAASLRDLYSALGASYGGTLAYGGSAFRDRDGYMVPGLHLGGTVIDAVQQLTAALEAQDKNVSGRHDAGS